MVAPQTEKAMYGLKKKLTLIAQLQSGEYDLYIYILLRLATVTVGGFVDGNRGVETCVEIRSILEEPSEVSLSLSVVVSYRRCRRM